MKRSSCPYNQDAFRAFALTVSNYAWYYKIYPKSYMPPGRGR